MIRGRVRRSQDIGTPFYLATTGLQKGLQEYRYQAGVRRRRAGSADWDYDDPAVLARHRVGVTDWLTLGGRFESTSTLVSGGPAVTTRTPVGELTVAAAASRDCTGTGSAGSATYSFTARRFGLGAYMTAASRRYATVTEQVLEGHALVEANAYGSVSMGALGSLSIQHAFSKLASGERRTSSSVSTYASISSRATLTVTATRIEESRVKWAEMAACSACHWAPARPEISDMSHARVSGPPMRICNDLCLSAWDTDTGCRHRPAPVILSTAPFNTRDRSDDMRCSTIGSATRRARPSVRREV